MSSLLPCYALLQVNTASFGQSQKAWMLLSKSFNLYERRSGLKGLTDDGMAGGL